MCDRLLLNGLLVHFLLCFVRIYMRVLVRLCVLSICS